METYHLLVNRKGAPAIKVTIDAPDKETAMFRAGIGIMTLIASGEPPVSEIDFTGEFAWVCFAMNDITANFE